jgi:hypothetical protein
MSEFDVPDIDDTTDSTTSFEIDTVGVHTYSEDTASRTEGVGTEVGDSSDEVNPRQLMGDPHLNELRWLYRTSMAKTIVDKPVDDAFKNGYEIKENEDSSRSITTLLENIGWEKHYKRVKKKARRDGFALSYFVLDDSSETVGEDPMADSVAVESIKKLETITLDDLARYKTSHGAIPAGTEADPLEGLDHDEYEIRPTGIVMDTDATSATYKEPLGYLIGPPDWIDESNTLDSVKFYHRNRFIHHTVNDVVDGDLDQDALGQWEGDSELVSIYHILRGLKKGNWSIMQTVFRYAAKMYHVELPEDANEEDWDNANDNMVNLNAKSELITPAGYEIQDFATDGQLQPREYFDVLFEQVCASTEMTKSVLFGTQSGTVSGSETDIKNYFNQVERVRQVDYVEDMQNYASHAIKLVDNRTNEGYDLDFDVEWGPLFKLSELDNTERLSRVMQTLSSAINNFILTPEEARNILQEEWSSVDIDWEDEFSEEEEDWLKTLNVAQIGSEAALPADENSKLQNQGNPRVGQNGGGMENGQQTASEQPTSDSLTSREIDKIADKVAKRLQ